MIGHLYGRVLRGDGNYIILDVQGVGYRVFVPSRVVSSSDPTREISLHIHTAVREDALDLYGFEHQNELSLFELLISISGIGPKSALQIIELDSIEKLAGAIARGDVGYLTKVSGVGKKSAEKIVLELREKVHGLHGDGEDDGAAVDADVLEALQALGYRADEAREALRRVPPEVVDQGARIKDALRLLSRS